MLYTPIGTNNCTYGQPTAKSETALDPRAPSGHHDLASAMAGLAVGRSRLIQQHRLPVDRLAKLVAVRACDILVRAL